MEMCTQSCVDHSILAIFEDSTATLENKRSMDEENEKLLSALTEMLDSVEDDDDTLSPFDTLPDSQLLIQSDCRNNSAIEPFAEKLRPRPKSPSLAFSIRSNGVKRDEQNKERTGLPQLFKQQSLAENKTSENEVEVFTSSSLVNLVKLMHPYCLKLQVDEGEKLKKKYTLFSEGEVWRYEKPTEESDEEINVISDDEAPQIQKEEDEQGDRKRDDGKLLKSVLVNRNSSKAPPTREKKRVSFGDVQVASFDEAVQKGLNEKNLTGGQNGETVSNPLNGSKALESPSCSAHEFQTPPSDTNSEKAKVVSLKGETKGKSLSLQQYRQLRQKRQPLVEKQGNYMTKWPSVPEPPKELPPIPCLQGHIQNSSGSKTQQHHPQGSRILTDRLHKPVHKTSSRQTSPSPRPKPPGAKPSTHLHRSELKRPRTESRMNSPASPLPDITCRVNRTLPQSRRKATLLSSDPPNPVLLPVPVSQQLTVPLTDHSSPEPKVHRDSHLQSIRHLHESKTESSIVSPQRQAPSSEPKAQVLLLNQDSTTLLQEIKEKFTENCSDVPSSPAHCPSTIQPQSALKCTTLQPQKCILSSTKETRQEPKTPQSPSPDLGAQIKCNSSKPFSAQPSPPVHADIPAVETLPKVLPGISPHEEPALTPQPDCEEQNATGVSGIEAPDLTSLLDKFEETQAKEESMCENNPEPRVAPVGSENTSRKALDSSGTSETLRNPPDLQALEQVDIPEALSTEIILSTQQDQPARRRNPPSKAIQIIDPRPLPSKKIHTSPPESPVKHTSSQLQLSVLSDHDYCGPLDRSLTSAAQRSRSKLSLLKDFPDTELQVSSCDSSAAAQCKSQTSSGQAKCLSAQPKARSETELSPARGWHILDCATGDGGEHKDHAAACTLPTPPPSPLRRGREKRRYQRRSPRSDSSCSSTSSSSSSSSSCSSGSRSPKRKRLRHKRSESSSRSSSCSRSVSRSPPRRNRLSYSRSILSRSRSRSWSRSRSRSPSPQTCRRWRDVYSRESRKLRREQEIRIQKLKAIDERRVVYVGRIRSSMTHSELRERFSQFGEVECVSLHFRDRGDHYAFVTFYNMEDAFAAIDNGGKLRKPDELPFDICFGGRRQFCNSNYSDLDANRDRELSPARSRFEDLDFDSLLKQAQRGLKS